MLKAFAPVVKQHAKNIAFFFEVIKSMGLIQVGFKTTSHAQNVEIVSRLFGYDDYHQVVNDLDITPVFHYQPRLLIEPLITLNGELSPSQIQAIEMIVKTIGIEFNQSVIELGRYTKITINNPNLEAIVRSVFKDSFLSGDQYGLWSNVAMNLLFSLLDRFQNFDDVGKESFIHLEKLTAFKTKNTDDESKIEEVFNHLLPICIIDLHHDNHVGFSFSDCESAEKMFFEFCYGRVSTPSIELRAKLRQHRTLLNELLRQGLNDSSYNRLKDLFSLSEFHNFKNLCHAFSYSLKVFLNLPFELPAQQYFYVDQYGSLSVNQSLAYEFVVDDSLETLNDFNYDFLNTLHEIENPTSFNYIIYKMLQEIEAEWAEPNYRDSAWQLFHFASDYMHESMDMYYLFNYDDPKAFEDAHDFVGSNGLCNYPESVVSTHLKSYSKAHLFPI